jgi:hypothetical protein
MRHHSDSGLAEIEDDCRKVFSKIAADESEAGVWVKWQQLAANPAVTFHQDCISVIESAAEDILENLPKTANDGKLWKHMPAERGMTASTLVDDVRLA